MSRGDMPAHWAQEKGLTRRSVLRGLGAGALAASAGGVVAACSSGVKATTTAASKNTITLGYISPFTGPLAGFASGDNFVISTIRNTPAYKNGFTVGGRKYDVDIVVTDSQSDPNRASQLARQLVLNNTVDLLLVSSTPFTVNPVAVVAETEGVPCLATNCPWEAWYSGLGGNPTPGNATTVFQYCALFFFGLKELQGCYVPMWNRLPGANKNVACQYPNDTDGDAFRAGFEPLIGLANYTVVDGGAYTDGTTDYTAMISTFKKKDCQYFTNAPTPPDFNTFWRQASEQGFKPKLATVAKVLLFPPDTAVLGPLVTNIATNSWWGPYMPNKSSLTGQTAKAIANQFQAQTGRQWVQGIGSSYSLFEIAHRAFAGVSDPHNPQEVAAALHRVNYTGMCGPLSFSGGPAPGVGIIPPIGVQWKAGTGKYPFEMKVVDNSLNKQVPIEADLKPTNA